MIFRNLLSIAFTGVQLASGAATRAGPSKVAAAWYAGWHAGGFPLSKVSWTKYTHLTYAFAETTMDPRTLDISGSSPDTLPQFVAEAHKHGVKALVSVGGWTGSRGFSVNVGSAQNRTLFVKTVINFATKYGLDGIDFDWEYPASQGIGCNTIDTRDTANFLSFLQELRRDTVGAGLIITAAAATYPFVGPNGDSLSDVKAFSQVLDWVAIMNYDIWGPWSGTVGPNAPLNDTCASAQNRVGSAVSAVQEWSRAGIPYNQLVLGVPAYGHSFRVRRTAALDSGSQLKLYSPIVANDQPNGDSWDDAAGVDVCGVRQGPGGNINYWGMIELGYLNEDGTVRSGISYRYDTCSQTPFVYNATTEIMVSFDNAQSFAAKGKFIRDIGLRGFATWEAAGDFNDILLNSIRSGAAF